MTGVIAERLGAQVITHRENMGKGEALRSLFTAAREMGADVMVTLDADAQHDPQDIPKLLEALTHDSADIVIGSRFLGGKGAGVPGYRTIGNKILNAMTTSGISDTQSGLRAYARRAIEQLMPAEMGMGVDSEILIEASSSGLKIVEVPVSIMYGEGKTSKHNPIYHTVDVISSVVKVTSIRHPLLFYGASGLVLIGIGLYFLARTVELYLSAKVIDVLTVTYGLLSFSLAMAGLLAFFTGIILFTISTVVRRGRS
jgi:hypothetical protein